MPGRLTAPGPGRSAALVRRRLDVSGTQNTDTSFVGRGTSSAHPGVMRDPRIRITRERTEREASARRRTVDRARTRFPVVRAAVTLPREPTRPARAVARHAARGAGTRADGADSRAERPLLRLTLSRAENPCVVGDSLDRVGRQRRQRDREVPEPRRAGRAATIPAARAAVPTSAPCSRRSPTERRPAPGNHATTPSR